MKKNILLVAITLISLFQFQSCKKDNLSGPEIQTLSATALAPNAAIFKGNIVNKGNFNPFDYGFIYSTTSDVSDVRGTKISLGKDVPQGEFTKEVRNLNLNSPYYQPTLFVRAYVTDEKGTALGKAIQINLPTQQIGTVLPNSGKAGDQVKISGKFYAESDSAVAVTFNSAKAKVISISDTEITVEIPQGIQARHGYQINVEVNIGGQRVLASGNFTVLANVKDFTPKSGPVGTIVTFTGDNLPDSYYYPNNFSISFGEQRADAINGNPLQILVPSNVKVKSEVSVTIDSKKIILPGEFTVTAPVITSISTETALPGTTISISGTNFPPNYTYHYPASAKIGGTDVEIGFNYQGGYNMAIPENISAGDYTISVTLGPHTVTAPKKLKVLSYAFTDFSPASGSPGKEVNITGNFVKDRQYTIYFGDVPTTGTATSATNLMVEVPGGINEGNVKIYLAFGGKNLTIAKEFKIIGPSIASFTPTSGNAGTVITIKGNGYARYYGTNVKFGTIDAQVISITENTITVAVPSNLNPGTMKLTVTTYGQMVVSSTNFTVTN
nr:IPT/TIG domain-containing protein [Pedobacter panaciterrae]